MTMRNVHSAEEQTGLALGKLEIFGLVGIFEAAERSDRVTAISTKLN